MAKNKLQGIKEFLVSAKDAKLQKGRSPLSSQAKRSKAEKALLKAMNRRGWKKTKEGYKLANHTVNTTGKDYVIVDESYTLHLGQGAINELDAYIKVPV